jgi:hypothetical protein
MIDIPIPPQFPLRNSSSTIATFHEPCFMSIEGFCQMTGASSTDITEVQVVLIEGQYFVNLESKAAKVMMARMHR